MFILILLLSILLVSDGTFADENTVVLITVRLQNTSTINVLTRRGDPIQWTFSNGSYQYLPNPNYTPLGMGFNYWDREIYFGDRGLKSLFKMSVNINATDFEIDTTRQTLIYEGTSNVVTSLSVDWMSGSVYWTDYSHNWIMVARSTAQGMYKRIAYTKLDRPTGIVVYPSKGFLYWSTSGTLPKIERSRLDGSGRYIFISKDLTRPQGLTIDYESSVLYWVDSWANRLESVDALTGEGRKIIGVSFENGPTNLYDLALYKDTIIMTDQTGHVVLTNKSDHNFKFVDLSGNVPFDIIVFDPINQPTDNFSATCASTMNCSDICVSDGNGAYHCICREGYSMVGDVHNSSCVADSQNGINQYIYSTDNQICLTDLQPVSQPECMTSPGNSFPSTLAFNYHSSRLFVADDDTGSIYRVISDFKTAPLYSLVGANKKKVHGLAVDWVGDNLYHADSDNGLISVSKLDGRYPKVLINNLIKPWGIEVNPLNGTLYWTSVDKVYASNMDGSDIRTCLTIKGAKFKGTSIDIESNTLFIVDQSLPGIRTLPLSCQGMGVALILENDTRIDDVTVFNNSLLWTNGSNLIGYAERVDGSNAFNALPSFVFDDSRSIYQTIPYGYNIQPMPDRTGGQTNICNQGGSDGGGGLSCSQLCLLRSPHGRTCACSTGFTLVDSTACTSELLATNFLLLVDPVSKEGYQFALSNTLQNREDEHLIRALRFQSANQPSSITYDPLRSTFYWLDVVQSETPFVNKVPYGATIKKKSIEDRLREINVLTIDKSIRPTKIDIISDIQTLIFDDANTGHLHGYDLLGSMGWVYEYVDGIKDGVYTFDFSRMYVIWFDSQKSAIKKVHLSDNKRSFDDIPNTKATNHSNNMTNNATSIETTTPTTTTITTSIRDNPVKTLMQWKMDPIKGLSLSLDSEALLVIWTVNQIYIWDEPNIIYKKRFENVNLTSVVFDNSIIYFSTWSDNTIYEYNTNTKKLKQLTSTVFNRIIDLRGFQSPDCCKGKGEESPSTGRNANHGNDGLIAGLVVALLLVLAISGFAFFMWRKNRTNEMIQRYYSTMVRNDQGEMAQEQYPDANVDPTSQNLPYEFDQPQSLATVENIIDSNENLVKNMEVSNEDIILNKLQEQQGSGMQIGDGGDTVNAKLDNKSAEINI